MTTRRRMRGTAAAAAAARGGKTSSRSFSLCSLLVLLFSLGSTVSSSSAEEIEVLPSRQLRGRDSSTTTGTANHKHERHLQTAQPDAIPVFEWASGGGCNAGYDFCGTLEYCQRPGGLTGYRQVVGIAPEPQVCSSPGPVIRMSPGKKYNLTLRNAGTAVTNLHTHGVHFSGDGNSDDVTRHVAPGNCLGYSYDVPANHMGGTLWYHAHVHTTTEAQVGAGAFGMLIIEDDNAALGVPDSGVEEFLARENEIIMAMGFVNNVQTANGAPLANVNVVAGHWYRMRLLRMDPQGTPRPFAIGVGCEAYMIARDGVYFNTISTDTAHNELNFPGASRADFALRCTSSATIDINGSPAATINIVAGTPSPTASPLTASGSVWSPQRPEYLQDLSALPASQFNTFGIVVNPRNINNVAYNEAVALATFAYDTYQEWTITTGNAHAFHLHLYHMQVVTPGGCGEHLENEWYDVISSPNPCTVRFRMMDIGGRMVFHCHRLRHEDFGSMGWGNVIGGPPPTETNPPVGEISCPALTVCTPEPDSCRLSGVCGTVGVDSCGNSCTVAEVTCSVGEACSAAGQCVCADTTCTRTGICGTAGTDTCGNACTLANDGCGASETCHDGSCTCISTTCTRVGATCGTAGIDNCGSACALTNDGCGPNETCQGGSCICTPTTCNPSGVCGTAGVDDCGSPCTVTNVPCANPLEACTVAGECVCADTTCTLTGQCGTSGTDTCGNACSVPNVACLANETCNAQGVCVTNTPPPSTCVANRQACDPATDVCCNGGTCLLTGRGVYRCR